MIGKRWSQASSVTAGGGTIWATIGAANREVDAARNQVAASRAMERLRNLREEHAFATALAVATTLVTEEVDDALTLAAPFANRDGQSPLAYRVRQRIQKSGFSDIRAALLRLGGEFTDPFFRLEHAIDYFASRWHLVAGGITVGSENIPHGEHANILDQLNDIREQATRIGADAIKAKDRLSRALQDETSAVHGKRIPG